MSINVEDIKLDFYIIVEFNGLSSPLYCSKEYKPLQEGNYLDKMFI